ncbi:MAG: glucuronate isomerase [Firmicutes bacterium]|nr:glucuronate isomerase [Bacillota bacterium]
MKPFMDKNFLLNSDTAVELFDYCKDLPIIDYHCHLIPGEIAENKRFRNITDLALGGDHYKWRLMRANGVAEEFITGTGSDEEKFYHWCATLEDCIGSPLYHWTHLEMRRYFDYDGPITGERAKEIFVHCNSIINNDDFSAWSIFKKFKVEQIGTTDDPADSLEYHAQMASHRAKDPKLPIVSPTFRPSKAMSIEAANFAEYVQDLCNASGISVKGSSGSASECWDNFLATLAQRIDFFHKTGCRISDHALDPPVFAECDQSDAALIFVKALSGHSLSQLEINQYKTALMQWLGQQYANRGWVMQLHMGAQRNNNTRMTQKLGPDTGYDSMSDAGYSRPLSQLLDALEMKESLPKTILYGLNPISDAMLSTMIGNFQCGGVPGKIQWGAAWWFNDTKTGMQNHLITLANNGVLTRFIGMLTDSRSFMSYPRHEYFRRIMVQTVADWVDNGEFPLDKAKLRKIVEGISYRNAAEYFTH